MQDVLEVKLPGSETAGRAWNALTNSVFGSRAPAKITIQIKFSNVAANWQLEVSQTDTTADVKQQITDKYKIPFGDQILSVGSDTVIKILKDDEKIKDCHIQQNDTIN